MKKGEIRLGLERVHRLLERLGHPEDGFSTVIIAGTNGKGSVSSFTESVLRQSGIRTGLYTSPHLVDIRERVRVNGRKISRDDWRRLNHRVVAVARRHRVPLTEFEIHTLAAFLFFQEAGVRLAVMEVGLGGRLDAVNALPAPEAVAITSIGHDHLEWLGPTLRHILMEKLGTARPGVPLLVNAPPALQSVARGFCRKNQIPMKSLGREVVARPRRTDWETRRQFFDVALPGKSYKNLSVGLLGRHQVDNAALAVGLCDELRSKGWPLAEADLRRGLSEAVWPGRFQVLNIAGRPVIMDGGHNIEGTESFAAAYAASPWGGRKASVIFGCLKDKDAAGMVRRLRPLAGRVFTLPLPSDRTRGAAELAALWKGTAPAFPCRTFGEAWRRAEADRSAPVVILGSLYLVGEALKYFRRIPS